jgi:hypothetical protein
MGDIHRLWAALQVRDSLQCEGVTDVTGISLVSAEATTLRRYAAVFEVRIQ